MSMSPPRRKHFAKVEEKSKETAMGRFKELTRKLIAVPSEEIRSAERKLVKLGKDKLPKTGLPLKEP